MADPAFRGFVESTLDSLLIFEGCRRNMLPKITRRLQEFEKRALVVSGAVFVFDEEETGIKRWTDGLSWSPSRTLGNFLVYRELDKKASGAAGSSQAGTLRQPSPDDEPVASTSEIPSTSAHDPFDDASLSLADPSSGSSFAGGGGARRRSLSDTSGGVAPALDRARERALVGSLTSTYRFRPDGLVKKTISLAGLHMIGYYKIDDVTSGRLRTPSSHAELISLEISSSFLTPSLFRIPPVVEAGSDGQLRYKGEPEAPMSPLTRSGSSQGFGTPALGTSRSRPPSSDSTTASASGRIGSPRLPPLSIASTSNSQRDPPPPGSPHRSSASLRSSTRFDPYSVGRSSPSLASYGVSSPAGYPFPSPSLPSPSRTTFSPIPGASDEGTFRGLDSAPLSPALPMMSSSAPSAQHWTAQGNPSVSLSRTVVPSNDQGSAPSGSSFYQPRHPTPFSPADPSGPATGGPGTSSSSSIFAYQPPPPSQQQQQQAQHQQQQQASTSRGASRQQGRSSPTLSYQQYPPPPYVPGTTQHPQHSQAVAHRPPSSHYHPQQSTQPQSHPHISASAYVPPPPPRSFQAVSSPSMVSSSYATAGRQHEQHSQHQHQHQQQQHSPHAHQQQSQQQQYEYRVLSQPSYPSYGIPGSQTASGPSSYSMYPDQRLASGLVMGIGGDQEDEARHGLGLGGHDRLDDLAVGGGGGGDGRGEGGTGRAGLPQHHSNILPSLEQPHQPHHHQRMGLKLDPQDPPQWWIEQQQWSHSKGGGGYQ